MQLPSASVRERIRPDETQASSSAPDRINAASYAVLLLVGLAVTLPAVFYDFVQDDHLLIVDNPTITSWRNLGHILTSDYFARIGYEGKVGYYRPLTNLSYLIDHTLWGLSPTGFHLTNVVMSIITTLLAFRVALLLLPGQYALLAGLFFAFHPGRVQAVGMITARSDLFAALFGFWAAGVWLSARDKGWRWWWVGVLLFCALLGKESSIAVVGVLGLWSLAQVERSPGRGRVITWCALGLPIALYLLVRVAFMVTPLPFEGHSVVSLMAASGRALGFYLRTLFLPIDTATAPLIPFPSSLWGFMLLVFIPLLLPLFVLKDRRAIAVGASWAVILVAPLLLPQAIRNPTIEGYLAPSPRFLYVPAMGVAVLWAGVLQEIGRRPGLRRAAMLVGVLWAMLLAAEFLPRLGAFANDVTTAGAASRDQEKVPSHQRSSLFEASLLLSKGMVLREEARLEEAAVVLERASEPDPGSLRIRVLLASLWHDTGRDSLAVALLREILDPSMVNYWPYSELSIYYMTGTVLLSDILTSTGGMEEALAWLRMLVERFPASWKAHSKQAIVQLEVGDSTAALSSFQRALTLAPRGRWEHEIRERIARISPAG